MFTIMGKIQLQGILRKMPQIGFFDRKLHDPKLLLCIAQKRPNFTKNRPPFQPAFFKPIASKRLGAYQGACIKVLQTVMAAKKMLNASRRYELN
jgi:hypothetical protein